MNIYDKNNLRVETYVEYTEHLSMSQIRDVFGIEMELCEYSDECMPVRTAVGEYACAKPTGVGLNETNVNALCEFVFGNKRLAITTFRVYNNQVLVHKYTTTSIETTPE
jgi:hypothetical protein